MWGHPNKAFGSTLLHLNHKWFSASYDHRHWFREAVMHSLSLSWLIHRHAGLSSVTLTHIIIPAPHSQIQTLLRFSSVLPYHPEAESGCLLYFGSALLYIKIISNPQV